jgi:hypothetical protein
MGTETLEKRQIDFSITDVRLVNGDWATTTAITNVCMILEMGHCECTKQSKRV